MILAIETATDICGAALVHKQKEIMARNVQEKNVHSEKLLFLIDEVLRKSSVTLKELNGIAVSIGPGSFTGLRIGLSSAKGLAHAAELPIIPIPTLDALAEEFRRTHSATHNYCAMIDAKREEVYFAHYQLSEVDVKRTSGYDIKLKKDVLHEAAQNGILGTQIPCNPVSVGMLAERNFELLKMIDFRQLEPLYIREFVTTQPKNR